MVYSIKNIITLKEKENKCISRKVMDDYYFITVQKHAVTWSAGSTEITEIMFGQKGLQFWHNSSIYILKAKIRGLPAVIKKVCLRMSPWL